MFCPNCGTQLDDGLKFCPQCGTEVGKASPQAMQPVSTPRNALIVVAIVAAALAIGGIVLYNAAIKPAQVQAHMASGGAYYEDDDFDSAIAEFTKAIKLDRKNAEAYWSRGLAYYDNDDDNGRVIADVSEAVRLAPDNTDYRDGLVSLYTELGDASYDDGDYDTAIAYFTEAIKTAPDDDYAYFSRGIAFTWKDDFNSAIADLSEAVRLAPNDATYKSALAQARQARGW
jgi:tetratricopeptide (TPR) repeat protein